MISVFATAAKHGRMNAKEVMRMSAADAETKAYLSNAERFADVFNF